MVRMVTRVVVGAESIREATTDGFPRPPAW